MSFLLEDPVGADEIELPEGATSLHFMHAIYRDPGQPMTRRMRAAVAALPFEHPKLSVNANTNLNFASQMEEVGRAMGKSYVIGEGKRYDTSAPLPIRPPPEPVVSDPGGGFKRRL